MLEEKSFTEYHIDTKSYIARSHATIYSLMRMRERGGRERSTYCEICLYMYVSHSKLSKY